MGLEILVSFLQVTAITLKKTTCWNEIGNIPTIMSDWISTKMVL